MWVRQVMNRSVRSILALRDPTTSSAVEVGGSYWSTLPWRRYETLEYPAFDLTSPPTRDQLWEGMYDVVIAEQVLEHVDDPITAMHTLVRLGRPGATVVVSTPFLIRIHPHPGDYWRFTPDGLERLMASAGLHEIDVDSWGNRRCVQANLRRWAPHRPWRSLRNEPLFPLVVWGVGTRPPDGVAADQKPDQ